MGTGFALTGQPETGAGINTAGYFYRHFFMNQDFARATAFGAGTDNNLSLSPTGWAGGSHREKALTSGDLTGSLAVPAVFRICSRLTRTAFALRTGGRLFKINFRFRPKSGIHETEPHVIAKVGASLGAALRAVCSGKSKKILENTPET